MRGYMKWIMDKIQRYPIIECILVIATFIGIYKIKASIPSVQEKYGVAVLYITFIVIAYYTVVQWKLKNLTSKQLTLNIRPLIVCSIDDSVCEIKNVGNGVAINIKGDIIPITQEQRDLFQIKPDVKSISTGDVKCLEAHSDWHDIGMYLLNKDGKGVNYYYTPGNNIFSSLNQMTIYYEDIEGTKYKTEMLKENGRLRVKHFS